MHKFKLIKSITSLFTVFGFLFGAISPVLAVAPTGLTMSPVNYSGNFRPGEIVATSFTLTNNTAQEMNVSLSAAEINNGKVTESDSDVVKWTTIDQTQLTLAPSATSKVSVVITIPSNATTGAYFPAILSKVTSTDTKSGSGAAVNSDLAFQMGINVTGELPMTSVQVTKLTVDSLVLTGRATVNYEISNSLTMFVKPIAYLQILDQQGQQVYHSTINESLQILRPGQKLAGSVTVDLPMSVQSVGQYRAELLVVDKQFSGSDILKASFYVLPIWLPIGVAVAVILLFVGSKTLLGKRVKKK